MLALFLGVIHTVLKKTYYFVSIYYSKKSSNCSRISPDFCYAQNYDGVMNAIFGYMLVLATGENKLVNLMSDLVLKTNDQGFQANQLLSNWKKFKS